MKNLQNELKITVVKDGKEKQLTLPSRKEVEDFKAWYKGLEKWCIEGPWDENIKPIELCKK